MASQITHIPYGKKVLDKFLSGRKIDEKKFYIGTLFPDIRYLGSIEREITHPANPTIEHLQVLTNDFEIGAYTHVLVDIERENVLQKLGAYNLLVPEPITFYAMKQIEDELTYNLYPDWGKIISYLDTILPEELVLAKEGPVRKWHNLLKKYFSSSPNPEMFKQLAKEINIDDAVIDLIEKKRKLIKEDQKLMGIIKDTYANIFS